MTSKAIDLIQSSATSLAALGVYTTATEMQCPKDLSVEDWLLLMRGLGTIVQASAWYVGDGLIHGEAAYGQMYAQAENELGLSEQTLTNYVYTCRHVAPDMRRAELSFGHHSAVASLEANLQQQYLTEAVAKGWSRADLREAIRGGGHARAKLPPAQPTAGHSEALAVVDAAAQEAGLVRQPTGPAQALLPVLTAVEDAARVVWGAAMEVAEVPQQLAGTFKAVPTAMLEQLGVALASVDSAASGGVAVVAGSNGGSAIDELVPTDDYPCTNQPPCAFVGETEQELWAHLRDEHGWQ